MSNLRYDIDGLSKEIVDFLVKKDDLIELKPDYYTGKNHKEFYKKKLDLLKIGERFAFMYLTGVRRVKTNKGWNIFYDSVEKSSKQLVWNLGNMKYIKGGYESRVVRTTRLILHLIIKFDGTVLFKMANGRIRTLSLQNKSALENHIDEPFVKKLLTLKDGQDWLEKIITRQELFYDTNVIRLNIVSDMFRSSFKLNEGRSSQSAPLLGNNIIQSSKTFIDFIKKINVYEEEIDPEWFGNISIYDIANIMKYSQEFYNPIDFLKDNKNFIDWYRSNGSWTPRAIIDNKAVYYIK